MPWVLFDTLHVSLWCASSTFELFSGGILLHRMSITLKDLFLVHRVV